MRRLKGSVISIPAAAEVSEIGVERCSAISPQITLPRAMPPEKTI